MLMIMIMLMLIYHLWTKNYIRLETNRLSIGLLGAQLDQVLFIHLYSRYTIHLFAKRYIRRLSIGFAWRSTRPGFVQTPLIQIHHSCVHLEVKRLSIGFAWYSTRPGFVQTLLLIWIHHICLEIKKKKRTKKRTKKKKKTQHRFCLVLN